MELQLYKPSLKFRDKSLSASPLKGSQTRVLIPEETKVAAKQAVFHLGLHSVRLYFILYRFISRVSPPPLAQSRAASLSECPLLSPQSQGGLTTCFNWFLFFSSSVLIITLLFTNLARYSMTPCRGSCRRSTPSSGWTPGQTVRPGRAPRHR